MALGERGTTARLRLPGAGNLGGGPSLHGWARWPCALVACGLAYGLQVVIWPHISPTPELFFYPVVFGMAWLGGLGPGVLAAFVSAGMIAYRFLPPYVSLRVAFTADAIDLVVFTAVSVGMSWLIARTRAAAHAARAACRIAEAANARKDEVLAVVSHDLRNPLNTTLTSLAVATRLLQAHRAGESRQPAPGAALDATRFPLDRAVEATERAARSTRRAVALVRRVLEADDGAGGAAVTVGAADVASILADIRDLAPMADAAGVSLVVEATSLRTLRCDRERTIEVLANLVENAVKFTPAGGRVEVRAEDERKHVRFSVRDTGIGIAPEAQARVFERYFRADRARPGTGLGLFIARRIVEAQGGRIGVSSMPGRGSTFFFTVPGGDSERSLSQHEPAGAR